MHTKFLLQPSPALPLPGCCTSRDVSACQHKPMWDAVLAGSCGHWECLVFTRWEPAGPSSSKGEPIPRGCQAALAWLVPICFLLKRTQICIQLASGTGQNLPSLGSRNSHLWWSLQPLGPFPHMQTTSLFCLGLSAAAFLFSLATGSSDWQVTNNGTGKSDLVWSFCLSPMLLAFHPESCT